MTVRSIIRPDPFLIGLIAAVALATVLPCYGSAADFFRGLSIIVIALMFFLQGARLSFEEMLKGLTHWKLHLTILCCTFILFPVLGLLMYYFFPGIVSADAWYGILFLCCLPSTVQSSIAFTSIARGNVPAAVCAATASNILGIFITPLLVGLLLAKHGASGGNMMDIVFQILLPFVAGQLLQPWIGGWARRNKALLSITDRSSVLIVVYTAFSAAVIQGLWAHMSPGQLGMIALIDSALLMIVLLFTSFGSRLAGFSKEDEITITFCGSKKTLASGMPMANVLFPPATVGSVVIPLMIYHQIQLFICAILAQHFARRFDEKSHG